MENWATKRKGLLASLADTGLVLIPYYSADRAEIIVKLAVDEGHMCEVAEMIGHKLQLKEEYLSAYAPYRKDYAGQREVSYKDRCVVSHLYQPHIGSDKAYPRPDAIFRTTDRIHIIDHIIREAGHSCAGLDLGILMHQGDILHYYPLHENKELELLDNDWFNCFVTGLHINRVRDYFGERIALYFLFMSHLQLYLLLPAAVGLVLWVVQSPLVLGTPDNPTAIPLCIAVGFWGTLFVHFWRRKCAIHALSWGTIELTKNMEPSRTEFYGESRINPVTERVDRYYPFSARLWKIVTSYAVLSVVVLALFFVVAMLFYLRRIYHRDGGRIMFQFINAVIVCITNEFFTIVAKYFTDLENHRTDSDYGTHLLAKTVIFKFINSYISLYYIAFMKRGSHLFGEPMQCVRDDCMNDMASQLFIFLLVRLTLQNLIELGVPYLLAWYRKFKEGRSFNTSFFSNPKTIMPNLSSAEKQCFKAKYDTFEDFDEVLILYGYTTLFVVACPWVPALALFANVLECFLDQKKLVLLYRRPFPMAAKDNEPWDAAFDIMGIIAMFTNVAIVVFVSHEFDNWFHWQKLLIFIGIEHIIILFRIMVQFVWPAEPREVSIMMLRQRAVVHKHFDLGGEDEDDEMRASAMRTYAGAPIPIEDHDIDEDEDEYC